MLQIHEIFELQRVFKSFYLDSSLLFTFVICDLRHLRLDFPHIWKLGMLATSKYPKFEPHSFLSYQYPTIYSLMVQLWKWVPPSPGNLRLQSQNVTWLRCNWMIKSQSWVQPVCEKAFVLLEPKFSELIRIWVILDRLLCRNNATEILYWKYNNVSSYTVVLSWPAELWFLSLSVVSQRPFTPLSKTPT